MRGFDRRLVILAAAVLLVAPALGVSSFRGASAAPAGSKPARKKNFKSAACDAWVNRLRSKIDSFWNFPSGSNSVTLSTTVNADGSVGDVSLTSSPSSAPAEQAANDAFVKAQPLEPLPKGAGAKSNIKIEFRSSSNEHGDSSGELRIWMSPAA